MLYGLSYHYCARTACPNSYRIASVPGLPREYLHYALIVHGSKTLKSRGRPGRKRHER